jgi:hypothetical protein
MSTGPERPADDPAIMAIAEQVTAGKDSIAVPTDMVEEPPNDKPPDKREPALWMQIKAMTMAERTKLALRGNKEARQVLIRDVNIQIQRLVLHNPRITEEEILIIAKDRNTDKELLAWIADSREWMKNYSVRIALVENARTPVAKALHILPTLDERELSRLGKSKQIPQVIAAQARRIVVHTRDRR